MEKKKKLPGAEIFGIKLIVDPSMTKETRKILFPEKLAEAKEFISKIEHWPPELESCKPGLKD